MAFRRERKTKIKILI